VVDLAGGRPDTNNVTDGISNAALVGEFTDDDDVVRRVYLERGEDRNRFYYYAPQTTPRRACLKEGSKYDVTWKTNVSINILPSVFRPLKLDIDEAATLSDENLAHTEIGNDGPSVGKLAVDGKEHDVYLEHNDIGFSHYYCYLDLALM
jgi:hypothetical protein